MANPVWPPGLPQRVQTPGYQEGPPDNVIRTPMDDGPPKTRRRSSTGPAPLQCVVRLSVSQLQTFVEFHHDTLEDGALPFDWVHPIFQTFATLLFAAAPSWTPVGNGTHWNVSMQFLILG